MLTTLLRTAASVEVAHVELTLPAPDGVSGTLAATEIGADTAAFAGAVLVAGALAATESGADTAAFSGTLGPTSPPAVMHVELTLPAASGVAGTLAVTESGSDTAAFSGSVGAGANVPAVTHVELTLPASLVVAGTPAVTHVELTLPVPAGITLDGGGPITLSPVVVTHVEVAIPGAGTPPAAIEITHAEYALPGASVGQQPSAAVMHVELTLPVALGPTFDGGGPIVVDATAPSERMRLRVEADVMDLFIEADVMDVRVEADEMRVLIEA